MGGIRRFRTALARHHRSRGFGIHSPFAFNFVRNVLREKNPYYCYDDLDALRHAVKDEVRGARHHRVVSFKTLKMLFRVANFFTPSQVLQVGTHYGLTATAMLSVSQATRLLIYEPHLAERPLAMRALAQHLERIDFYNSLPVALADARATAAAGVPMVLVNGVESREELEELKGFLAQAVNDRCVVMIRNLNRDKMMRDLWKNTRRAMSHGQTFTNDKTAVIVALNNLNLEHFFLWF